MPLSTIPRLPLAFTPTPLTRLPRLTSLFNKVDLWIKRDDQTGLGLGGNKTRKLEFLLADALQKGCDTVITAGAAQSNHCRQTAAAAASQGLECHLVLGGDPPETLTGNALLDVLFGANLHWTGEQRKGEQLPAIIKLLEEKGRKPYMIPYGGSNEIGALGYVYAMQELQQQLTEQQQTIDTIIFASSSAGTHAGLMVGAHLTGFTGNIIGIGIDKTELSYGSEHAQYIVDLSNKTAEKLKLNKRFSHDEMILNTDYFGEGYGIVGTVEKEAIGLMARHEGIVLDPVYTGRAMAGLIDMIRQDKLKDAKNVLFWHTGGAPAVFHYSDKLV